MGLKSLIERLKHAGADTPDTPEKITGYQCKAPIHAGCTPDTPDTSRLNDVHANMHIGQFFKAVNDPAPEPPADPKDWHELASAYHIHHFNCPACVAVGRGAIYGPRCGVGTALWNAYQSNSLWRCINDEATKQ